jgi:hypothetical protein
MQIQENTEAYGIFIQIRAEMTGKEEAEIRAEITPEEFESQLRQLHHQWLSGEFSFGKFTELIGVPHLELWEILDLLGLALHR